MRTKVLLISLLVMIATACGLLVALATNKSSGGIQLSASPSEIKIYNNSQTVAKSISESDAEYEEILKLYNSSFTGSYFEQVKQGDYFTTKTEENVNGNEWNEYNKQNGLYLEFLYESPVRYIVYRGNDSRVINISSIIFKVSSEKTITAIDVYYAIDGSYINDKDVTGDSEIFYPLTVNGKTNKLYSYLKSII